MSESRVRKYDRRRLPREKRAISIFGATAYIEGRVVKDQSNKFYRCWNCGFLCNTDRNKLGDGVGYHITDEVDSPAVLNKGAGDYEFPREVWREQTESLTADDGTTILTDPLGFEIFLDTGFQQPLPPSSSWDVALSLERIDTPHLVKLDSQGDPVTVMHNHTTVVTSGCPMCGNKNYK